MPDPQAAESAPGDVAAGEQTLTTEISIVGANCPWCFNETIDVLRHEPGVVSVDGSMAGQCMRIEHRDVETERLMVIVRGHLHGEDMSSAEHVMVAVDPRVAEAHCAHRQHDEQQGTP